MVQSSRRNLLAGLASIPLVSGCLQRAPDNGIKSDLAAIEAMTGGRHGVAALDITSGRLVGRRLDERFAMCSTFKWLLGALVLKRVDRGEERLDRKILIRSEDMVFYAPVTGKKVGETMTVAELASATIRTSDNPAANLLLADLGGPAGFTARIRSSGDMLTRLDRLEPMLNENRPGDPRDTSTPRAMVRTMQRFLFGNRLSPSSRSILIDWMSSATTGLDRLRAGLPAGWAAGDKTGTSERNQSNDVAFAIAPDPALHGPLLIVSFLNVENPIGEATNAVHADIAKSVSAELYRG